MALEAMDRNMWAVEEEAPHEFSKLYCQAFDALRAALAEPPQSFVRERAQLEQEWCELRQLQAEYKQAVVSGSTPEPAGWALWMPGEATPRLYHTTENSSRAAEVRWLEAYAGCAHVPLYAHPQRQPLSDKEINHLGHTTPGQQGGWNLAFAHAIEKAHGIK